MRWMLMAGWLVVAVTPLAWGQGGFPPGVAAQVEGVPGIRLEFGAGLVEMRRARVHGSHLSGALQVPKPALKILGLPISDAGGRPFSLQRSVDTLIPVGGVLTLEVQNGTQWRRGALIGVGVGAAFGALFVATFRCFGGSCILGSAPGMVFEGAWISAVGGMAFGAGVGAMTPRWKMIYRRGEIPLPALRD